MRCSRGFVIVNEMFGEGAALFRFSERNERARQHVVEPERSQRAWHPQDSNAYVVDRRPVNSTVRCLLL